VLFRSSRVKTTLVNGVVVFDGTTINDEQKGMRMSFNKIR